MTHQQIGQYEKPAKCSPTNAIMVFIAMSGMFGRLWESQFGEIDGATFWIWATDLERFSGVQIKAGIERCKDRAIKLSLAGEKCYPPNLIDFIGLCHKPTIHPSNRELQLEDSSQHAERYERGAERMKQLRQRNRWKIIVRRPAKNVVYSICWAK